MAKVKREAMGLVKEMQCTESCGKVSLDDADFLRVLIQQILTTEFEDKIQAVPGSTTGLSKWKLFTQDKDAGGWM